MSQSCWVVCVRARARFEPFSFLHELPCLFVAFGWPVCLQLNRTLLAVWFKNVSFGIWIQRGYVYLSVRPHVIYVWVSGCKMCRAIVCYYSLAILSIHPPCPVVTFSQTPFILLFYIFDCDCAMSPTDGVLFSAENDLNYVQDNQMIWETLHCNNDYGNTTFSSTIHWGETIIQLSPHKLSLKLLSNTVNNISRPTAPEMVQIRGFMLALYPVKHYLTSDQSPHQDKLTAVIQAIVRWFSEGLLYNVLVGNRFRTFPPPRTESPLSVL